MNRCVQRILAAAIALAGAGCSPQPRLADGPFDLDSMPTVVRFEQPVHAPEPEWEFTFEFDLPADSDHAGDIHATLLTSKGGRYALSGVRLDRRGERLVSQIGRLKPDETGAAALAPGHPLTCVAVELRADVPVRVRTIWGGGRP